MCKQKQLSQNYKQKHNESPSNYALFGDWSKNDNTALL